MHSHFATNRDIRHTTNQLSLIYCAKMNLSGTIDFRPKLLSTLSIILFSRFKDDLIAGIVVGIVALPLAIAFGIASGVKPYNRPNHCHYRRDSLYRLCGGNSVQIGGPTGAFIVIVYSIIQNYGLQGLAIATLMAGMILILLGLFHLGTVIKFIPYPIVVGFTSGIALTIFSTQINDFFGLGLTDVPSEFLSKWGVYLANPRKYRSRDIGCRTRFSGSYHHNS